MSKYSSEHYPKQQITEGYNARNRQNRDQNQYQSALNQKDWNHQYNNKMQNNQFQQKVRQSQFRQTHGKVALSNERMIQHKPLKRNINEIQFEPKQQKGNVSKSDYEPKRIYFKRDKVGKFVGSEHSLLNLELTKRYISEKDVKDILKQVNSLKFPKPQLIFHLLCQVVVLGVIGFGIYDYWKNNMNPWDHFKTDNFIGNWQVWVYLCGIIGFIIYLIILIGQFRQISTYLEKIQEIFNTYNEWHKQARWIMDIQRLEFIVLDIHGEKPKVKKSEFENAVENYENSNVQMINHSEESLQIGNISVFPQVVNMNPSHKVNKDRYLDSEDSLNYNVQHELQLETYKQSQPNQKIQDNSKSNVNQKEEQMPQVAQYQEKIQRSKGNWNLQREPQQKRYNKDSQFNKRVTTHESQKDRYKDYQYEPSQPQRNNYKIQQPQLKRNDQLQKSSHKEKSYQQQIQQTPDNNPKPKRQAYLQNSSRQINPQEDRRKKYEQLFNQFEQDVTNSINKTDRFLFNQQSQQKKTQYRKVSQTDRSNQRYNNYGVTSSKQYQQSPRKKDF